MAQSGTKFPDIVTYATEHGLQLKPRQKNGKDEVYARCPFCNHHNFKLSLNPVKNCYRCWHCSEVGGIAKFIASIEGVSEQEVIERYRSKKTRHMHPALKMTHEQRRLIGCAKLPDWELMRQRDPEYFKRTLDLLWDTWKAKEQELREDAYTHLYISIITGEIEILEKKERVIKLVEEIGRRINVPILEQLREAYRTKPDWAKSIERRMNQYYQSMKAANTIPVLESQAG
jgi:hypothetical protein